MRQHINMFQNIDDWVKPPDSLPLSPSIIHVWACELTASDSALNRYKTFLTTREMERLERFYFEKHQKNFGIAHGMLHVILSRYLHCAPIDVTFDYQSHGKPEINSKHNPQHIQFNLSHSGDIALLAIALQIPIGIDVEQIKPRHYHELAETIMTSEEYQKFLLIDEAEKEAAFFHVWTQKEAVIKALGKGLSFSLKKFNVSVTSPAQLISLDEETIDQWTLQEIPMPPGYKAAFATKQLVREVKCFEFRHPAA